jgi:branched-chain amino acid transport system substrate-binding protein
MKQKIVEHLSPIAIALVVMLTSAVLVKIIENTSFSNTDSLENAALKPNLAPTTTGETTPAIIQENTPNASLVKDRLSSGEKILVKQEISDTVDGEFLSAKQRGVEAMTAGNYKQAIAEFEAAIQKYPNAPETLIYLNNAKAAELEQFAALETFTIAVAVPIGNNSNGALEILRGVAQAQYEANDAQSMNQAPIKVVIANDDDDPTIAQQIAKNLVNNPKILGVIGHFSSGATLSAGREYNAGELVAISPSSTDFQLSDFSRYVFRTVPSDRMAAKSLAQYMLTKLKKQKAAVFFNSQSTYSESLKMSFVEEVIANGGQVDQDLEFDMSAPNFSASRSVEQAIAKGAQVLMLAANTSMLDKTLLIIQANNSRLNLLGSDDIYTSKILADGGKAAVGLVVPVAWHIDSHLESDFARKSQELWQNRVNWRTAMSYDATQALITAIRGNPTRSGIQQMLSSSTFSATGASGDVRFLPSGDRSDSSIQLVEVRPRDSSDKSYNFVPIR